LVATVEAGAKKTRERFETKESEVSVRISRIEKGIRQKRGKRGK